MQRQRFLLFGIIVALAFLLWWQPSDDLYLQPWLFTPTEQQAGDPLRLLRMENDALRAELAHVKDLEAQLPLAPPATLPAFVYARYPFNLKDRLFINTGRMHGIRPEQPVFFGRFLIGKVEEVALRSASVVTIFDHSWQQAVRIGERGVEALLVGGVQPRLTLIEKEVAIREGDVVVNGASQLPYGAPVGEAVAVALSTDRLSQEADLRLPYGFRDVRVVFVGQ